MKEGEIGENTFATFETLEISALDAINEAQRIAFAPIMFHAVALLRDKGILSYLRKHNKQGATIADIAEATQVSPYGVRVLLEAGLGAKVCILQKNLYYITKVGLFIDMDQMTRINMNFSRDVCYSAMDHLEEAIDKGYPAGLKELGNWDSIYEGLSILPEPAKTSWFNFDHFYSDNSFKQVMPIIFAGKPKKIFDIGGNTGKFSLVCCEYDAEVQMTICDLPVQLTHAEEYLSSSSYKNRIELHAMNVLDDNLQFPGVADAIMMSQFLDCFSTTEITEILRKIKKAVAPGGKVYIIETLWDRQKFEASAFSLQQTSLYFTAIANGNSKMYGSEELLTCVEEAGYELHSTLDNLGISHTMYEIRPK